MGIDVEHFDLTRRNATAGEMKMLDANGHCPPFSVFHVVPRQKSRRPRPQRGRRHR